MDLTLQRVEKGPDGVFGSLTNSINGVLVAVTLERAYQGSSTWNAKIPEGKYLCLRGRHQLSSGKPFETFEVTGVPGHFGLLFHPGNFDSDSKGCILVGETVEHVDPDSKMVTNSREAFATFMIYQEGLESFNLTVRG